MPLKRVFGDQGTGHQSVVPSGGVDPRDTVHPEGGLAFLDTWKNKNIYTGG